MSEQVKITDLKSWWAALIDHVLPNLEEYKKIKSIRHHVIEVQRLGAEIKAANSYTKEKALEISQALHGVWFYAPDNPSMFDMPCWFIICDLCSENWVIHE
jgi:hypothetical protein